MSKVWISPIQDQILPALVSPRSKMIKKNEILIEMEIISRAGFFSQFADEIFKLP